MASKNCSKCKTLFECTCETPGCWCEGVFIDQDTLNEIKRVYENCLCPACLKEYATKQASFPEKQTTAV